MTSPTALLAAAHKAAFRLRMAVRSAAWRPVDHRTPPGDRHILITGFFNEALGIGRAAHLVADAMAGGDYTILREDLRPFDRGLLTRAPADFATTAPVWLIVANPPEAQIALYAHAHAQWRDMYRIGFWHWESDEAPVEWAQMTRWFDEVWFSSAFAAEALAKVLRRLGRTDQLAKLRVHPLPVPAAAPPTPRHDDAPVLALTLFDPRSDFDRKNPQGAVDAWLQAFPEPKGSARLIVKSLAQAAGHPRFQALQALTAARPDIELRAETLSTAETEALIARCDLLISLHRGEGFGLPLAEAMARSLTVIATGWSGNMQFMTPDNSICVPYRLVAASPRYNGPAARWAEPDIAAAASALRRAVTDADLRGRLGRQARADISHLAAGWSREGLFSQNGIAS